MKKIFESQRNFEECLQNDVTSFGCSFLIHVQKHHRKFPIHFILTAAIYILYFKTFGPWNMSSPVHYHIWFQRFIGNWNWGRTKKLTRSILVRFLPPNTFLAVRAWDVGVSLNRCSRICQLFASICEELTYKLPSRDFAIKNLHPRTGQIKASLILGKMWTDRSQMNCSDALWNKKRTIRKKYIRTSPPKIITFEM